MKLKKLRLALNHQTAIICSDGLTTWSERGIQRNSNAGERYRHEDMNPGKPKRAIGIQLMNK